MSGLSVYLNVLTKPHFSNFSAVSGVEMKNLQRSEQAHFLVWRLYRSILRSPLTRPHSNWRGKGGISLVSSLS